MPPIARNALSPGTSRIRPLRSHPDAPARAHGPSPEPVPADHGLPHGREYVSFRGDPSLQESAPTRAKIASAGDGNLSRLIEVCVRLLTHTDCHSAYIGFNRGEVRTESIRQPFAYQIHAMDALMLGGYLERHFSAMPFDAKINAMEWIQRRLSEGPLAGFRQGWTHAPPAPARFRSWRLGSVEEIGALVREILRLREAPQHYLRSAAISLGPRMVRATFDCDATYVIPFHHVREFVAGNFGSA